MSVAKSQCPICGQCAVVSTSEPITVEFRDGSYTVTGFTYASALIAVRSSSQPDR